MCSSIPLELDYPPLMLRQIDALQAYASKHGECWRERLQQEWLCETAEPLLYHLRTTHGSYWLFNAQLRPASSPEIGGDRNPGARSMWKEIRT